MATDPTRIPVVLAAAHAIERDELVTTVDLAERAGAAALSQVQALADRIQRITMVGTIFSPSPPDAARQVAERLKLPHAQPEKTTTGGNTPQWLVTRAAAEIAAGRLDATLIVGAEAARSARAAAGDDRLFRGDRSGRGADGADPLVGAPDDNFLGPAEIGIRLVLPAHVYPIFESAIAAAAGRSLAEHRAALGELMAGLAAVAARHPYAWFRDGASAADLATPTPDNRIVAEPYTKRMNAFPNVDQGSALVVCSLAVAEAVGAADRAVFVWSGANTTEVLHPAARPELGRSPAIAAAARRALEAAGIGPEELGAFDLYSCFPCAVEMAAEAIGIDLEDPRGLTVTGGLPYFGGPGNNYVGHSIATMVERVLETGEPGLCTGLGGFVTKHAVGIYGPTPPRAGFRVGDTAADQEAIDSSALVVTTEADGVAVVDGSTVVYGGGEVVSAPVIATLEDGRRIAAQADPSLLQELAGRSLVGEKVRVAGTPLTWRPV